jgi:phosphate transport system protein
MKKSRLVFQEELKKIKQDASDMIVLSRKMIEESSLAFAHFNAKKAQEAIKMDDKVDKLDNDIENKVIEVLATQQPMAKDLRFIFGILKIITDIERLGDYSVDNAKLVEKLNHKPSSQFAEHILEMKKTSILMLDNCLFIFKNGGSKKLKEIILMDDKVDERYYKIQDITVGYLKNPEKNNKDHEAMIALMAARNLERIADHISNICRRIYYILEGEHIGKK